RQDPAGRFVARPGELRSGVIKPGPPSESSNRVGALQRHGPDVLKYIRSNYGRIAGLWTSEGRKPK
ncbi:MAG TPA: hypothetical protein PLM33_08120, partial [Acidobacteriota bacterium]|nr:hypothetical protein [Acidobacteriota bacterium]